MKGISIVQGDAVSLAYQVLEDGLPKDITGMTFSFAAKLNIADTTYWIAEVAGVIDDAASGKFHIPLASTDTDVAAGAGVFEIIMESGGNRTTLSDAGGTPFAVFAAVIVDVAP